MIFCPAFATIANLISHSLQTSQNIPGTLAQMQSILNDDSQPQRRTHSHSLLSHWLNDCITVVKRKEEDDRTFGRYNLYIGPAALCFYGAHLCRCLFIPILPRHCHMCGLWPLRREGYEEDSHASNLGLTRWQYKSGDFLLQRWDLFFDNLVKQDPGRAMQNS